MTELGDRLRVLDRLRPPDLWPDIRSREPGPYGPPPSWRRPLAAGVAFAVAAAGIGFAAWAFTRGDSARPAGAPAGRIAFVSDRDGDRDLYVMAPDGTGISNLTENDVDDYAPAWSPDGTRIAFVSERDGNPDVYVINADGTGVTRLTDHPGEDTDPTWSPDGRWIAFTTDRDGNFEIYVMDADGAGLSNLTRDPADDIDPAWSPDGSRIAFARTSSLEPGEPPDVASILQIHVMAADGSGVQRLTELPGAPHNPAWSPDGGRLAFEADGDIYTMNADGRGVTLLAREPPPGAVNRHPHPTYGNYEPVWSLDGRRILFVSDRDGDRELYVMDADATEDEATRLVRSPGNESQPTWQPVVAQEEPTPTLPLIGKLAFSSYRDGRAMDVYLMSPDGSAVVRLTESEAEDHQPAWSPDGTRIVFSSTRSVGPPHTEGHIYVMNADGSEERRVLFDLSNAGSPAWSPDGTRIALAGCCNPAWDIYVMNPDGSGLVQLTRDEAFDSEPSWSPDGTRIAFARDDDGTGPRHPSHGIYVIEADGEGLTQLTEGIGTQPAWSPDGTTIAFAVFEGLEGPGIYVMNADGSTVTRLTTQQDTQPAWSPDGTKIAFTSYRVNGEGDIFVMNPDGSEQTRLTDNPFGDYDPAWQPVRVTSPSPSPSPTAAPDALSMAFHPATYGEDGLEVMPVTFPDGTTAELAYPPEVDLAGLDVRPNTQARLGSDRCGFDFFITRRDPRGEELRGDAPIKVHEGVGGQPVELWKADPAHGGHWLRFRIGSWHLLMPCDGTSRADLDEQAEWAASLGGHETPDGFLVLEARPPLELHPFRDTGGPALWFEGPDVLVELRAGSELCDSEPSDRDVSDGVVQWCIQPEDSVYLYANAFGPEGKEVLRGLVEALQVRNVGPAA